MTINLYSFVGMYDRVLTTANHLLDKGAAHAEAQGKPEAEVLGWRLIDDMHPLGFQLMTIANFTRQWPARAAGVEVPPEVSADLDLAGWKAALADAKAYLATLTPDQFAERDDVPVTFTLGTGVTLTLPAGQWITGFATTNIYFHLSTAYGILRHHGVQIGKRDMFAGGL
jgi:hypothetical protein